MGCGGAEPVGRGCAAPVGPGAGRAPCQNRRVRSPFDLLADRVTLGPRHLRLATLGSLLVSIMIIVTGGVVRVTGSGLGCPTWPSCTADSFSAPEHLGVHGVIEYTNRVLTSVVCLAVAAVIITARLQKPVPRSVLRSGWAQFFMVVLNAVVGGLSVLTGLNPYVVAAHFLAALVLLTAATHSFDLTWSRPVAAWTRPAGAAAGERGGRRRRIVELTVWATGLLVLAGTVVTGAGPHPGDSREVHRIGIDWWLVTTVHGLLAVVVTGLVLTCLLGASPGSVLRRRAVALLALLVSQGALGLYQSLSGVPAAAVGLHLFGAALIWVGAVRLWMAPTGPDPDPRVEGDLLATAGG